VDSEDLEEFTAVDEATACDDIMVEPFVSELVLFDLGSVGAMSWSENLGGLTVCYQENLGLICHLIIESK